MTDKKKIRVLVVDDSAFMRIAVKRTLESDPAIEVIGQGKDGAEAVQLVEQLQPDVVTMDFNMPRMNGVEALRAIFAKRPVPVIMLSAHTQQGAQETLDALAAGALDFVPKPDGEVSTDLSGVRDDLLRKVKGAARSRPSVVPVAPPSPMRAVAPKTERVMRSSLPGDAPLLVIAISTGGPAALERVIPRLPTSFGAGVVIVQHMPKAFTKALASRLDGISALSVREAEDGDVPVPGQVLIAPGDRHLTLDTSGRVKLLDSPPVHGCRPAADVTLQAIARSFGARTTVLVMTGMGRDGALGAQALKAAGGKVLAQDEASSVVFGMPKAVIERGLADQVIALDRIAPTLIERFG
ncbi:MAG: chemotaxis response regulator protein-glutamate methylesterase [Sandaracinus sp.]|nr:chemotaxis response regulator protein-glutamate methylesterase [Sandaracinus sp.]MCB9636965.1 chemotaxis response regulator protein-glutamate methylesterase [Sandaracinus sp.]